MKKTPHRPDPARLLEAYVASNRCDKAFAALVESLNGLVYSSALRRTGNTQLAEEIAQNVFALLARKARSLRRHPSLTAWALETTRLLSANAMRSERRRRRKVEALTREVETQALPSNAMEDQCTWKDAVPFLDEALDRLSAPERKVILQRFYEEKKFKEIAVDSGQSEDACKKRTQRALQKLTHLLTSRGVTLSGTAVASLLGAEMARAAPAHITAAIAPKALAASSTLTTTSSIANSIQTMGALKNTSIATAAVVALAAVPISQQIAEGNRLRSELQAAQDQPAAPTKTTRRPRPASRNQADIDEAEPWSPRTASSLLDELASPPDYRALAKEVMAVSDPHVAEEDPWSQTMVFHALNSMSEEEYDEFLNALADFPAPEHNKKLAKLMLRIMHPGLAESWQETLERVMARGKGGSSLDAMTFWAREDPDAALAWYREKVASGEILGKGLETKFEKGTFASLVTMLAASRPEEVMELLRERPQEMRSPSMADGVTSSLAKAMIETGDDTHLLQMFEFHDRSRVLQLALKEYGSSSKFGEGVAFVERFVTDPGQRADCIVEGVLGLDNVQQQTSALNWLRDNTPEAKARELFRRLEASGKISAKVLRQVQNQ